MKVTDALLIAVAELVPLQLRAFEKTLSLSLSTDSCWLLTALESEDPLLLHEDQPPKELELKVVVDIGELGESGLLACLKNQVFRRCGCLGKELQPTAPPTESPKWGISERLMRSW